jgi:hypothetical protein
MDFSLSQTSISTEDIGLCSRSPDDATEQIQRTAEEAMDVVEAAYARFTSLKSLPSSPHGPRTSRAPPSASSASGSLLPPPILLPAQPAVQKESKGAASAKC